MKRICSITPVHFDAKEMICDLVRDMPDVVSCIYLVGNGVDLISSLEEFKCTDKRIEIVEIKYQVGKLEAVRQALEFIIKNTDYEVIAQTDIRLKQSPSEIDNLLSAMSEEKKEMILSDRYLCQDMNGQKHRLSIVAMLSVIMSSVTDFNYADLLCGTRVYTRQLAEKFLHMRGFGYGIEVEQFMISKLTGASIGWVPISSNRQDDITNAEKIEDSLYTILSYLHEFSVSNVVRESICNILVQVKMRKSFIVNLEDFGRIGNIKWNYIDNDVISRVSIYSGQGVSDGYNLNLLY